MPLAPLIDILPLQPYCAIRSPHLSANTGDPTCTPIGRNGFVIQAPLQHGCLTFEGYSFDDNYYGPGNLQPQNVCLLAMYGNKAPSLDKWGVPTAKSHGTITGVGSGLEHQHHHRHWYGLCDESDEECPGCTNNKLITEGTDWSQLFSTGNSCGNDGQDTTDEDICWNSVHCYFTQVAPPPSSPPRPPPEPPSSPPPAPPKSCLNPCTPGDICLSFRDQQCSILEAIRPLACDCRGCCVDPEAEALVQELNPEPSPAPDASYLLLEKASNNMGYISAESSLSALVVSPLSGMLVLVAVGVALLMARKRAQRNAWERAALV